MLSIQEAIEQFKFELPEEIRACCQSPELHASIDELQKKYGVDLSPLVIYFAVGEVTLEQLGEYIRREYEIEEDAAKGLIKDLEEKVFKPLAERIDFINDDPDKAMTFLQEKNYAERMFKYALLRELNEDPIVASAINTRLLTILARDKEFHKRLEQVLYENDELVTAGTIMIEGQELKATVANWIKDFIAHYGSENYDSVSLSAFLVNSENARPLSDQEREGVSLVLKVYTNVKFFPDTMPDNDTGEGWQIIPYEDPDQKINEIIKVTEAMPDLAEKISDSQSSILTPQIPAASKITAAPSSLSESPELLELKNEALQYPVGSLERAAIEEEIKRLSS
jgi:hypothetical protein